ncbi:NmrA family NAD(P)-binding protein [Streptomyces triticirhizae]|uniref:SDR family NAD(P)-dependent oxidoreductase n=1 Tax=Streptomyces triticirhizae TaxID=2483353 RepID=A0A3M2M8U5_9ACTN|nr:NAD(P)H-binding protein [Streptomyces triticirhizae]RMI43558.1 SDR family NAD(P)-dependent oxidoreductase [Streptomyces triticirhizae]
MTNEKNDEIVVLGGTGKTGRWLVRDLRAAGHAVRPASRSGEVRFDWSDRDTWPAVVKGATAVYLIPGGSEATRDFVRLAVDAGVRRLVTLSGRGMDRYPPEVGASMFPTVAAGERAVRESGVEWSIIRANNFNQNFDVDYWLPPLLAGRLALPTGGVPEPFVDTRDVAAVAAALLTEDGHHGRAYDVSGPRALTFDEAVAVIAGAAGREIRFVELTPEEYQAELRAEGVPEETAAELGTIFEVMRAGHLAEPAPGVREVLGREPISFESYATEAAKAGAWA